MEGEESTGSVTHPECWLQQTEKKSASSASLPRVSIAQRAPDANVVLLLGHLGRNAHADLVEPLVTAAVTLDPVHLQATAQQPHFQHPLTISAHLCCARICHFWDRGSFSPLCLHQWTW